MIQSHSASPAVTNRRRCPKCSGQLYLEQDAGTRFVLPPEWTCLLSLITVIYQSGADPDHLYFPGG